jgi:predicted phage baseplate assembly protein
VVRLKTVTPGHDALTNEDVYEVTWFPEDALPFALRLSVTINGIAYPDVTIACGNVVVADFGQKRSSEPLIPASPVQGDKYLPTLRSTGLTFATPFSQADAVNASASEALRNDPHTAVAALLVTGNANPWLVMPDLLRSGAFDRHVVVEAETDGSVRLRFGDDVNGMAPIPAEAFTAIARTGNGTVGNVGRDTIVRVVTDMVGIENVWNPLPATGGVEPEPIEEVRQYAPEAYKVQERAVTEADYAMIAERFPEVQNAQAEFRWTGSWYTVFLVVDRLGGNSVTKDPKFRDALLAHMDRYRMAGVDLELRDPIFVSLEIVLHVCVSKGYFAADVRKRLQEAFGTGISADGTPGFFNPDNFTFGDDVYLSRILSTAMGVQGVDHVQATTFKRWAQTANAEIAKGRISIAHNEIAQCADDPNFPENGQLTFELEGGL